MADSNGKHLVNSYLAVLAVATVLYVISCAPTTLWQDSGMFQYRIWNNDIEGGLGLALAHPLYHIIGIAVKYIPIGEFGYRVNLISAVFAAITVANLFLLLKLWLGRNMPAVLAVITLALSHTLWQHASIAEVYTLYTALFSAELIFLLQYFKSNRIGWLYLLGLFNGLAIANHLWATIPLICYAAFLATLLLRKRIYAKNIAVIILLWIVGAAPYEYLIAANIIKTGNVTGTLYSAFFGPGFSGAVFNISISSRMILENMMFIGLNFPTPNILFLLTGILGLYKVPAARRFNHIMLALLILFFVFAFRYTVPDRYAFFIPFYCLASAFIGVGMYLFFKRYPQKIYAILILAFVFLPLPVYKSAPMLAEQLKFNLGTKRTIPYRNDYTYFLRPWQRHNYGPQLFAREALESVENNAIIIADGTTVYPLWYLQEVKGTNTHVKVVSQHGNYKNPVGFPTVDNIKQLMANTTVYVVSPTKGYCPQYLLDERYDFIRTGPIYRVVSKQ